MVKMLLATVGVGLSPCIGIGEIRIWPTGNMLERGGRNGILLQLVRVCVPVKVCLLEVIRRLLTPIKLE